MSDKTKSAPLSAELPMDQTPLASIVVTLNTRTGDLRIAGNVLVDPKLAIHILIEAMHQIVTTKAVPTKPLLSMP